MRTSPLPEARLGFIFAAILLFADFTGTVVADFGLAFFRFLALTVGVSYWFFCLYRLHVIINELDPAHPISPMAAVTLHLPPFYSLYWMFKWPIEFSRFVNSRGFTRMVSGRELGLALFGCVLLGQIFWGLGLAAIFLITWYLGDKLSYELQYHDVFLPSTIAPSNERTIGGIFAGNMANYLVANTGFVLLLLFMAGGFRPSVSRLVFPLIFMISAFMAGLIAGNVAGKSEPGVGIFANLAVFGSVFVGILVSRQNELILDTVDYAVFMLLAMASFGISVLASRTGRLAHARNRYPYLRILVQRQLDEQTLNAHLKADEPAPAKLVIGGRVIEDVDVPDDVDTIINPRTREKTANYAQWLGSLAAGNFAGGVVLLFYQYPAAFIEYIWGENVYVVSRIADMLVIVTAAFVAAYVAMVLGKKRWQATVIGANLIMYLTVGGLLWKAWIAQSFWTELSLVLPVVPVIVIAGIVGAKAAQNNLNRS